MSPKVITSEQIQEVLKLLGLGDEKVNEIHMYPDRVEIIRKDRVNITTLPVK